MTKLLLVEDDDRLSLLIDNFMQQHQIQVTRLSDGTDLMPTVNKIKPDIIILDVMLPGEDGFALCRKLRAVYQGPLLFLTAREDGFDQVLGLELGADDYIIKPVEPRILLARVHALLRRAKTSASENPVELRFGQLSINSSSRRVTLAGEAIALTSHEFDMLLMLAQNASQIVDRNAIYEKVIGREYDGLDRSADVRVSRLRKKLNDNQQQPYRIKTIWGKGFFFVADAWD